MDRTPYHVLPNVPYEEMKPRQKLAYDLTKQGKTYEEIGRILSPAKPLSRQRVHQILTGYRSPSYLRIKGKATENKAA